MVVPPLEETPAEALAPLVVEGVESATVLVEDQVGAFLSGFFSRIGNAIRRVMRTIALDQSIDEHRAAR